MLRCRRRLGSWLRGGHSGWRRGASPSSGRTCARWRFGPGTRRARSSSSRPGLSWAECSGACRWPPPVAGCGRCHSPCLRGERGQQASNSGAVSPLRNPRPDLRSAGRRWGTEAIGQTWIFVERPPRERPIAWLRSPLYRLRRSDAPSRRRRR